MASIQPASTARRSVFGLIRRRAAALLRLSQGASSSGTRRWTGMPWWERRAVTRSRVQRLPWPVLSPLRLSMPAMTSSRSDEDELAHGVDDVGRGAVALTTPAARQPQLGVDPAHPVDQQHDLAGGFVEVGDDLVDHGAHDPLPEAQRRSSAPSRRPAGHRRARRGRSASVPGRRRGRVVVGDRLPRPRPRGSSARFQRASSSAATSRFSGSAASYCRKARSRRSGPPRGRVAWPRAPRRGDGLAWASASTAAATAAGSSTLRSAASTASSTLRPPNAMQLGSPLSSHPRRSRSAGSRALVPV